MSKNEHWFSEVGDSKESLFGVVFVLEEEINNFHYGSAFIRGAVNIEDRDGFREFKEMELGTFGIVLINKLSGCTTAYQSTSRLDFSGIHSFKFHLQLKRIGLSCYDELGWKSSLPFWLRLRVEQRCWSRRQR